MPMGDSRPAMEMNNVSKFFGDFKALNNVPLNVGLGERVVVCGPSGSGKSTLIRCINRLEKHETGQIIFDGTELSENKESLEKVRACVGMVFMYQGEIIEIRDPDSFFTAPKSPRCQDFLEKILNH